MKIPTLATIYLDNEAVGLMGDPRPLVSKIVVAGGKKPDAVQVLRGRSAGDTHGKPVRLDDTIDRTAEPATPIYLTCTPRSARSPVAINLASRAPAGHAETASRHIALPMGDAPESHPPGPFPIPDQPEPKLPDPAPHLGQATRASKAERSPTGPGGSEIDRQ